MRVVQRRAVLSVLSLGRGPLCPPRNGGTGRLTAVTLSKEGLPNEADCARRAVAASKGPQEEAPGVQSESKLEAYLHSLP